MFTAPAKYEDVIKISVESTLSFAIDKINEKLLSDEFLLEFKSENYFKITLDYYFDNIMLKKVVDIYMREGNWPKIETSQTNENIRRTTTFTFYKTR